MVRIEIEDLLDDFDVKEQVKNLYLETICKDIPDKYRLSSRFSFRTFILGYAYELRKYEKNEKENASADYFSKIETLAAETSKIQHEKIDDPCLSIKAKYLKGIFQEVKNNHDLFLKVVMDFPQRLKEGRDVIAKTYQANDDISYKDLFESLVFSDLQEFGGSVEDILYDYGSRKVLETLGEDEEGIDIIMDQRKRNEEFKKSYMK